MLLKKVINKVFAVGLSIFMFVSTVPANAISISSTTEVVNKESHTPKKNYIVMTRTEEQVNNLEEKYDSAEVISGSGEKNLQENHMAILTLSEYDKEQLIRKNRVEFVEEDFEMTASTMGRVKKQKKKRIIETIQRKTDEEWNMRMIRADSARKKVKRKRKNRNDLVKIAVLDTGVDYNADINIAETISIVPGEERINPLFIDATGHGTSVAGLMAAKDNDVGITGVDPYAEIYSIRVLDDENRAPVSRVIEGIYMAIDREVDIINMSFGMNTYSRALERAVKDALDAGVIVVAAAGNAGVEKGKIDSTIQYPAAFDGVLAVGAVDKRGEISENSLTGNEVDLVAPGELVRSTGMFDSEVVASGTSLAAPQVAGAAALILEQDKNVSSDFVRKLLCESANSYGEKEIYGSGLLDVEYAVENYDLLKKKYDSCNKTGLTPNNTNRITVFEDTGCVEGCWTAGNHENLVSDYGNVKKGARFNDIAQNYRKYFVEKRKDGVAGNIYMISGMDYNPWWHGYFRKNYAGQEFCNYVAAYIYETRVANSIVSKAAVKSPGDLSNTVISRIQKDVNSIPWTEYDEGKNRFYSSNPSSGTKRAFVWGMAIHTLADAFAHSSATFSGTRVKHNSSNKAIDADNTSYLSLRWSSAQKAVNLAIKKYTAASKPSGTSKEFSPVKEQGQFKLINIEKYITSVDGRNSGASYAPYSVYKKYDNGN